ETRPAGDGSWDVVPHALDAVVTDHEPELESAKPPAERDLPIAVVDDRAGFGRAISQVLREHAQCADERRPVRDPECVAIEVREHPLVRVEAVAVGELEPVMNPAELGAEPRSAAHRRVHVKPQTVAATNLADRPQGIDRIRRGRADGGGYEEGL